jgi:hypothetical protein
LLGVDYVHLKTADGGDLYLTESGLPFWRQLLPENWYDRHWFVAKRERLKGTSTVYRVPTKQIDDQALDLVVKWSRVGEVVALDTLTLSRFIDAEFNSPFEEFALVTEMRQGQWGPPGIRIQPQVPLAIYVPSERLQLWQTGRFESKIAAKIAKSPGVELDILRQYVLLYEWVKGLDLVQATKSFELSDEERAKLFAHVTSLAAHELEQKGYSMVDMKPQHIIVQPRPGGRLRRDHHGQIAYAIVDYELVERTADYEAQVQSAHRRLYLEHMAHRFMQQTQQGFPPHLKATNVLGVDYIFGHAESTGGRLWVVGKDPALFNYFLPERWRRTPKRRLSSENQVYHTHTKDNVYLVWKVSRVGNPAGPASSEALRRAVHAYGFNSPFEEFAYALELSQAHFNTVYPRAIYMTGHKRASPREIVDHRRFEGSTHLATPEGEPALSEDHDYITIWGFWNGPDEWLAVRDGLYFQGINAEDARARGLITDQMVAELLARTADRMARAGFQDLNLKPDHLLLSLAPDKQMVQDSFGRPQVRLCNLELVQRLPSSRGPT